MENAKKKVKEPTGLRVVDFSIKGSMVKLYLGSPDEKGNWVRPDYSYPSGEKPSPSERFGGDDWNDMPYEHNAGRVYDEYVKGEAILAFDFDDLVLEPSDGAFNTGYSKDDMEDRKVPCVLIIPAEAAKDSWEDSFAYWAACDQAVKIYMGDPIEKVKAKATLFMAKHHMGEKETPAADVQAVKSCLCEIDSYATDALYIIEKAGEKNA